ncbi:uncharacterized protein MELLADRAFT_93488 [Melampsora larici-populina 98AG31]|uniref:RRM domain-containing protein n=1 Tax=Melampsora larici-populina (strain 98AG31 / pathotype 3-4-7) TaxID=747676 RepID=F4RAK3_MELLP|nr:uncharacterized protein MELLADRAFT_93488 [Melampsora larici-populina 98AG31]EGG10767.1 hypothetical protein MELLADRAFT_93488 [Melampsora larici-populina 98AG31]
MFEKILQHLVQFSDDLQNESRPTIDCGVLTQLQRIHVSHANEPKYSSDWDPSLPLPYPSSPHDSFDPLLFSRDGTQFTLCQQTVDAQIQEITTCRPVQMTGSDHPAVSYIGSGLLSATRNASGSCSSTDKSLSGSVGSPPFTTNRRGPGFGSQAASAWKAQQIAQEEAADEAQKRMADKLVDESIIPSQDPSSRPKSINVFVANFPAHWGKSDLWDLFEGIAIASVHVITDSGMGGDANASGGTGFINVIRREDAEALLGLLDKKIWLIEGSALKFRAANSSAPTEMIHSHPPHRNRTIRRHPHKVLDRLRSEQITGYRQVGACDRHQIVIYKSVSADKMPTLAVVHGSRQRNNNLTCATPESTFRHPHQPRTLIDELRTYLSRSNRYNNHYTNVPAPPVTRSAFGFTQARPTTLRHPRPTPATVLPLATMSTNIPAPRSLRLAGFLEVGGAQVGYIPQASGVASCYVTPYTVFPRLQPINAPGYIRTSGYRGNEENYPEFSWMPN